MTYSKHILILLFCFSLVKLSSQNLDNKNFKLNWKQTKVFLNSGVQVTIPTLDNEIFNENLLPVFSETVHLDESLNPEQYVISNIITEIIDPNSFPEEVRNSFPNKIEFDFQKSGTRDPSENRLMLIPVYMESGVLKKITAFDLSKISNVENVKSKNLAFQSKNNSVLSQGNWYKFSVDTTGIFIIDKDFLNKLGIPTNNLNPKNIRIFGNGGAILPQLNADFRYDDLQENAIFVEGENDDRFDNADYVLFYGIGPDSWKKNPDNFFLSEHVTNIYSDQAYYFITVDQGPGLRISDRESIESQATENISTFQDYLVHEFEERNLFANGQQWLGEDLSFNNVKQILIDFTNIEPSENLWVRMRGVAISSTNSSMGLEFNGQNILNLNFAPVSNNSLRLASTAENFQTFSADNSVLQLNLTFNNNGNPSARGYLDYLEILGTKKLIAPDNSFSFRNFEVKDPNAVYRFTIQNGENLKVWDVSNPVNPKNILNQSNDNSFSFSTLGDEQIPEFIGFKNEFLKPGAIEFSKVPNQNLHALKDIDYVLITAKELMSEAKRLTDFHQTIGLRTGLIDLEEIYNEFGSGSPDLTAIRDFIRFLYLNSATQPKYICLFGDASFDFKDRINNNNNIVPAFQSYESFNLATGYVTDDYFGMMDTTDGLLNAFDTQEVITGRIPVSNLSEAKTAVDKILRYYSTESFGDWRNQMTVVADDPDDPSEFVLQETVDQIAQDIEKNRPVLNIKKIYSDAYQQEISAGGERYPQVNTDIDEAVNSGTLLVNYFGHGGVDGWANERILEVPQIQNWKNTTTLPLFITVTCEFARFDNPLRPTAGEYTLWNNRGGATSLISTTREIFISTGQAFNRNLFKNLLAADRSNLSAEALRITKNETFSAQKFFVYYFGDPAMELALAKPNIQITKMNGMDLTVSKDTLKALSKVTFEGFVSDINGQIIEDFNGEISATVFDKPLQKQTLDNDNFGRKMDYASIESKIFRGRASVENGLFSFSFVVPKDIRIAYGNSKMSFYANSQTENFGGFNREIIIGGLDANAPEDDTGPEISLFLNDESFVEGGTTNSSPLLLANLSDASGINTSITAVDHDIVAILDNDEANPIILNDYFKTELNDFTKGQVKYLLNDLEPGLHNIKFKCWDTYNNLSESALNFVVVDDSGLVLSNVLNYPNPFISYTEFWFNHNKPNELLETQVQIFTVSGKLVKTLQSSIQTQGTLAREIVWDGLDDFGNKIGKGVYIYKLKVTAPTSKLTAEKIEKLVIL